MAPAWVQSLLRPAGLTATSVLAGPGGRYAVVCGREDPNAPFTAPAPAATRVAVLEEGRRVPEEGRILGVYSHSPPVELLTQTSCVLLSGTQVLYTSRQTNWPAVARLDVDSLELESNFFRPHRARILGLDVDPAGRYALIAWQAHRDFPSMTVFDSTRERFFDLACDDLVGARLGDVRWNWPEGITCYDWVRGQQLSLPVDFDEMRIAWEPRRRTVVPEPSAFDPFAPDPQSAAHQY